MLHFLRTVGYNQKKFLCFSQYLVTKRREIDGKIFAHYERCLRGSIANILKYFLAYSPKISRKYSPRKSWDPKVFKSLWYHLKTVSFKIALLSIFYNSQNFINQEATSHLLIVLQISVFEATLSMSKLRASKNLFSEFFLKKKIRNWLC